MHITNALVIRIANAMPDIQTQLLAEVKDLPTLIKKANELKTISTVDHEQNKKLDELIGAATMLRLPDIHVDAFSVE